MIAFRLSEWLLNGRSVGKIALGIRVVMIDGSQPGIGAYLLRWVLRIVESVGFLGGVVPIITVAANGRGQPASGSANGGGSPTAKNRIRRTKKG